MKGGQRERKVGVGKSGVGKVVVFGFRVQQTLRIHRRGSRGSGKPGRQSCGNKMARW